MFKRCILVSMNASENRVDMINSPIFKSMMLISLPLIFSYLIQLLFNAADIVVVGKFAGEKCLAAVSSTTALVNLITCLFVGMSVGTNVVIAKLIGKAEYEKIPNSVHTSISFAILTGIGLMILGLFISEPSLRLMNCPSDIIDLATIYLKIYFLGMPGLIVYNFGSAILRAVGDTRRPLVLLIISGVVNVVLNLILVIFFNLDVVGVAVATAVSQSLSAFLIVSILIHEDDYFHLDIKRLKIDAKSLIEIIKVGLPAGLVSSSFSISNVILQTYINALGTTVVAASGASSSLESFANGVVQGICQAETTYVSQNYGAKKYDRIKKAVLATLVISFIWCLLFVLLTYFFGKDLFHIYTNNSDVIEQGMIRLRIILYTYYLFALMQIAVGSLRGIGYSTAPAIISILGVCGVRLFSVWFVFKNLDFFHIMITYPISWLVTLIILWIMFVIVFVKQKRININ